MAFFNEATAETITKTDKRAGKLPYKKMVTNRLICQGEYGCGDRVTLYNDNVEPIQTVFINFIGDEKVLSAAGKKLMHNIVPPPSVMPIKHGDTDIPTFNIARREDTEIYLLNDTMSFKRLTPYTLAYQSVIVKEDGQRILFDIKNNNETIVVKILDGALYLDNTKIMSLPPKQRIPVFVMVNNGSYVDENQITRPAIFIAVSAGKTIDFYDYRTSNICSAIEISTYDDDILETVSSRIARFPIDASVPVPILYNHAYSDTFQEAIISQAGAILSNIPDIINILGQLTH